MTIDATSSTPNPFATNTAATAASIPDPLTDKNTFLQLLVAQLKHQDPSSPQDSTQFVAQLAQFSNLEKTVEMRDSLKTISDTVINIQAALAPPLKPPTP